MQFRTERNTFLCEIYVENMGLQTIMIHVRLYTACFIVQLTSRFMDIIFSVEYFWKATIKILRPEQIGQHFGGNTFIYIFHWFSLMSNLPSASISPDKGFVLKKPFPGTLLTVL